MALIEKETFVDKVKRSVGDKMTTTLLTSPIFNQVMQTYGVNDKNEFVLLDALKSAKTEVAPVAEFYQEVQEQLGLPYSSVYFNLYGLHRGTLPFYDKFSKSNGLSMILKGKANKVIDASIGFEKPVVDEDQDKDQDADYEEFTKRSLFKQMQMFKDLYGKVLINITNVGDTPEELDFELVEPFRYAFKDEKLYILTYLGHRVINGGNDRVPMFNVIERREEQAPDGEAHRYFERTYDTYVGDDGLVLLGDINGEREIDGYMAYEIINDVFGKSTIREIEHELLMYDTTETMLDVEVVASKITIHADKRYFENGQIIRSDVYTIYDGVEDTLGNKPLWDAEQPAVRIEEYQKVKAHYMNAISTEIGMSARALGMVEIEHKVATIALLDEEMTIETVNDAKRDLKEQMQVVLDDLYDEAYNFVLEDYQPQSLQFKAEVVKSIGNNASTEQKTRMMFPNLSDDEVLRETTLVKIEKSLPLTTDEMELAKELGLLNEPEIGMLE